MRWTACGRISGRTAATCQLLEVDDDVVRLQFAGQLQELSVVGGHPRVRRRGRGPRGRTRDHLDRSRCRGRGRELRGDPAESRLIPVDALMSRVRTKDTHRPTAWHPVPDIADLGARRGRRLPGRGRHDAGLPGRRRLFAYHDRCGSCGDSMAGAALHRARWPARNGRRSCGVRAATRISTPSTPVPRRRNGRARPSRADPAAGSRRRAVDGGSPRRRRDGWHRQRHRRARTHPRQPRRRRSLPVSAARCARSRSPTSISTW